MVPVPKIPCPLTLALQRTVIRYFISVLLSVFIFFVSVYLLSFYITILYSMGNQMFLHV